MGASFILDAADGVARLVREAWAVVLPRTCVVCGEWLPPDGGVACAACRAELAAGLAAAYCPRCGRTMARAAVQESGCVCCRPEHFWNVVGVARVGGYTSGMRRLLTGLKYGGRRRNADFAAGLLGDALVARGWAANVDGLVPVPMHWLRRWQRPCDHADLLAAALSRRLHVPVLRAVRRVKHTPSQTQVASRTQRFENIKGCFRVAVPAMVRGRRVCIVDNLLATGATVHEVAKVLRRAGARAVYAAVVARTVLADDVQATAVPVAAAGQAG